MKTPGHHQDAVIAATAAAWVCERDEGFAPGRERAFAQWRDEDPRHAAALVAAAYSLALLAEMPAARDELEARFGATAEFAQPAPGRRRLVVPRWAAGLAAAGVVLGTALFWWRAADEPEDTHVVTEARAQRRVELADGSVVSVNGSSDVRVRFAADARRVTLASGEAHFEVAPDPARPFIVAAGEITVRAVGTAFNVRVAATGVEVLVVEGKVELERTQDVPSAAPALRPLVAAGERASVSHQGAFRNPQVEKAAPELIRATLAWHSRVMNFSDVPLRDVVRRFNQRNATQLVIPEPELGARRIGGSFALDHVEAFVRLLEQEGGLTAERRGEREIVLRSTR